MPTDQPTAEERAKRAIGDVSAWRWWKEGNGPGCEIRVAKEIRAATQAAREDESQAIKDEAERLGFDHRGLVCVALVRSLAAWSRSQAFDEAAKVVKAQREEKPHHRFSHSVDLSPQEVKAEIAIAILALKEKRDAD